jgi:L-serine/L-threonine ammonia-lyase
MENSLYFPTHLINSVELSNLHMGNVYLKMENEQPSGSFKNRGIGRICSYYAKEKQAKYFISSSGGNAGLAVAYSGKVLNVPVKVIIPTSSPAIMIKKIKSEGAEVIRHGKDWNEADVLARELANEENYFYISPFDHPLIWQGHASIVHEIKEYGVKPDAIILSVGGGGLLCGVIQGLHEIGWQDVSVFTAETEGAASFAASVEANKLITLKEIKTVATSLGAKTVTSQALDWNKKHVIHPCIVSDKEAINAVIRFADDHRVLVEPACGAALSLIYDRKINSAIYKNILVIVCGGSGVTRSLLKEWETNENIYS